MVENHYADAIGKHFNGFIINTPFDHNDFGVGDQRHFRIDAKGYVSYLNQQSAGD